MLVQRSVVHDARVRREARALVREGLRVWVVALARREEQKEVANDGFELVSALPTGGRRDWMPSVLYRVLAIGTLVRRIRQLRPDVVHAHDVAMLLPGAIGARLTNAALVYDTHEYALGVPYRERFWRTLVWALEKALVPRCDGVITVSAGIAERLRERFPRAATPVVIRNVADLPVPQDGELRLRSMLRVAADEPIILHQGAAAAGRGCEILIRAFRLVERGHLVFLGSGEPRCLRHLRQLAVQSDLEGRVHFLPPARQEELLALTSEATVGVSLLENTCENHRLALPNKLFEYIAAGVPVVTSDLPEMARLVRTHGVGWTVDAARPESVASGLRAAIDARDDPELAAKLRGAAHELSWGQEQRRLLELYAQLDGRD
jgi:glycosyltransferase involved in cell wall biosynthesis